MVEQLSYYCGTTVFSSFIQKKVLWLTSLRQSNDTKEGTWMRSFWLDLPPNRTHHDKLRKRGLAACLDSALHEKDVLGICFSEERDLLSQWRGYANDGAGFSITFNRQSLEEIAQCSDLGVQLDLCKVIYGNQDNEEINAVVRQLAGAFSADAQKYTEGNGIGSLHIDFGPKGEKHALHESVARALFTVRNGAFREEREWRVFAYGSLNHIEGMNYRVSNETLSPYLKLSIPAAAIEGVTIEPTNSTPRHVVKAELTRNGLDQVWVKSSTASYRNK